MAEGTDVEDAEVIECVAAAVGASPCAARGARVFPLSGKQGLLVCRVHFSDNRSYVFKAIKETSRREIAVSSLLSRSVSALVPHVYAAEEDCKRGLYWLICEDVGPRRLADSPSVEGYVAAAVALARLQIAALDCGPDLCGAGVPLVDTPRWEEIALRGLEADGGTCTGVDLDRASIEEVVWAVTAVAIDAAACPSTLVHGDLHAGNVAICAESAPGPDGTIVRLLDWGSAYHGAAFLGLEELLWPGARHLRTPDQRGRVRAAYLREWASLLGRPGPLEKVVAACAVLVRLELLDEALRRPHQYDAFAAVTIQRRLLEAFEAWKRA